MSVRDMKFELAKLLTLPYTFRGQKWSIFFSLSNIEFT